MNPLNNKPLMIALSIAFGVAGSFYGWWFALEGNDQVAIVTSLFLLCVGFGLIVTIDFDDGNSGP